MTDKEQIDAKLIQIFTEKCVDILDGGGCIIHFPEIEIFNENDTSKIIYDLYVRLFWEYSTSENTKDKIISFTTAMQGARSTYTVEDIWNTYSHSHLPSLKREGPNDSGEYYAFTEFQEFCLGEDTLYNTLAELSMGFNIDKFIILLNSIDDFVRWESLSGGPYMLIEELVTSDANLLEIRTRDHHNITSAGIRNIVKLFIKQATDTDIKKLVFIHDTAGTTIPRTEEILKMWEDFAITVPEILSFNSRIIKYEDKYYQQNTSYQDMLQMVDKLSWEGNIYFKGEKIKNEVDLSNDYSNAEEIKEKGVLAPHPAIFNSVMTELEFTLTKYLTKTDTWKLKKQDQLW